MCFRPSSVEASVNCPQCGKAVHQVLGAIPNECPFCEADLSSVTAAINAAAGINIPAPGAPGAPSAPGVPSAPSVPGAPSAPGAPKA